MLSILTCTSNLPGESIYTSLIQLDHLMLHFLFSGTQFFLITTSHTYTNVQSLLQTCCTYVLLTRYLNLWQLIKMLTVKMKVHVLWEKTVQTPHLNRGWRGRTKSFSLQLIMHCINSPCYLVWVCNQWRQYLRIFSKWTKQSNPTK